MSPRWPKVMSRLPPDVEIRAGTCADLAAINDIYNHYVAETHITFDIEPWDLAARQKWLNGHGSRGRHRLLVLLRGGFVQGYATSAPVRPKRAYETSVETTIYLAPSACGEGLGRQLYARLLELIGVED